MKLQKQACLFLAAIFFCCLVFSFQPAEPVAAFNIIDSEGLKAEGRLQSDMQESQWVLLLRQFGLFFIVVAFIFLVVFIVSVFSLFKYLASDKFIDKVKIVFKVIFLEPAKFFSSYAPRDKKGTYQMSFWEEKEIHNTSKKSLVRFIGLLVIVVLIYLIVSLGMNHAINAGNITQLK